MDLLLIHRFEVSVLCYLLDRVCDVLPVNLGDLFCDPVLDADCCKAEGVLLVGFVLGVAVVCDFRLDGAFVGTDEIGGRS